MQLADKWTNLAPWQEEHKSGTLAHGFLCTGVFHARPTVLARRLLYESLKRQEERHQANDTSGYYDDQNAFNDCVYNRFDLGLSRVRIEVLDPWVWTSGWVMTHAESMNRTVDPVLVHVWGGPSTGKIGECACGGPCPSGAGRSFPLGT